MFKKNSGKINHEVIMTVRDQTQQDSRTEFIIELNKAFASGDTVFIDNMLDNDIAWNLVGDKLIVGKRNFMRAYNKMKSQNVQEVVIETILSRGSEGFSNGLINMKNGRQYSFCDLYTFSDDAEHVLKRLTSYVIRIQ